MKSVRNLFAHPRTQTTRKIVRRTLAISSVILAVMFVFSLTYDLGKIPGLRAYAERKGTEFMSRDGRTRQMHIGGLELRLWDGAYVVRDLTIEDVKPGRPWLTAKQIIVSMPNRGTLWNKQIEISSIDMSDWKMHAEVTADGRHNFPKFTRDSKGTSSWTTTLRYVRASRGEFTFEDQGVPWGVVARNIDVTVAKPADEYRGSARFSNGRVAIQDYLPFRADMDTTFKIAGGRVLFEQISLDTDGAKSVLKGDIDMAHWPEQMYSVKSTIDMARMRQIFFAKDKFDVAGTAQFDGYFHLFKGEVRPDGTTSGGREVKGTFRTSTMRVNDYQLQNVAGSVRWVPRSLLVHDATARLYGGDADFEYSMEPLGVRGVKPTNHFAAKYRNVDMTTLSDFFGLQGITLAGRASGDNLMEWPSGRFRERAWRGTLTAEPPPGTKLMTRTMPVAELKTRSPRNQKPGEFSPHLPKGPVPIGGTISYSLGPEWIDIGPSQIATPTTYVEIEGRTAYGERSMMPFHVSSSDWQDSDRLFAGMLTALGSKTKVIPVDGYGTFDGVMLEAFRRPKIEGRFAGEDIRAFDVTWGSVTGDAVIENAYANVKNVVVSSPDGAAIQVPEGKFSLGYPRRDGGEQINARIRLDRRPVGDLKHAFDIDAYDFSGTISGEFTVTGEYERPIGSGTMTITQGNAYGETFETATADVRLEGDNVRLDNIRAMKGSGEGRGSASITWNGTYAFNFAGTNIAAETLTLMEGSKIPFSGAIDFTADGSGSFEKPQYKVHATIRDLFVADEGIGTVVSDFTVDGERLTFTGINANSARLSVFGSGTIALNDTYDTDLRFTVTRSSLDPYIRAFEPRLSPYTTAIVSGALRVYGELSNIDNVLVDATVDEFDARLFDFQIRNKTDPKTPERRVPIRLALDRHSVRVLDMQLEGQDTDLVVSGDVDLHNETIAMRMNGGANLRILEGFTRNVRSQGRADVKAALTGALRNPVLNGSMEVNDGRIRHFSLPHALDRIAGVITFDSRGVNLDELTAYLGGGPVTFGGSIGIEGYVPGRVDVTITGENMTLRYPDSASPWLTATVDAGLTLEGTVEALLLRGNVSVRRAQYTKDFTAGVNIFDFGQSETAAPTSTFVTPTLPLSYDVRITAPATIQANNNLLRDVVASADVRLVGTFDHPGLYDNIDVDRGDVFFAGNRYQIRTASIRFSNSTAIEPFFDIEATTRKRVPGETYLITVNITGPDFSNVTFSSDPSLPELQLMALLFSDVAPTRDVEFRQYVGITPQQQLLRESITRALASPATGEISRAVQDALAVESFQFSPTLLNPNEQSARLDPSARVTILKRVGNRVYLTFSRSLSSTTRDQVIVLEIDQTDHLSWILSRNEDGTYALDFRMRTTF